MRAPRRGGGRAGPHARQCALLTPSPVSLLLFYCYVEPLWSEARQEEAIAFCVARGAALKLGGRIRVAREGFNTTVSGSYDAVREFAAALKKWDAAFLQAEFKYVDGEPNEKHFAELKVIPCAELVHYGLNPMRGLAPKCTGTHLEPADFHKKLQEPNTVLIDVRNHYEVGIGHFGGQATLLDPLMRVSTEFPAWARSQETKAQLEGKQVLMCCTGGIRCERASGVIRELQGVQMNGVFQLQGGIEKYLQAFPDGGLWQGKNFTFDKRGDVARSTTAQSEVALPSLSALSVCCACAKPWDVYLGKRKCAGRPSGKAGGAACGVPVLVCESCLTDRVPLESLRCPLCAPGGPKGGQAAPPAAKPKPAKPAKQGGKQGGKQGAKPAGGAPGAEKGARKPGTKAERVAKRRKEDARKKRRREEKRAAQEKAALARVKPWVPPPRPAPPAEE